MHEPEDRLNASWSRTDPRYSDESVLSAQLIRSAQGPLDKRKGWVGRSICQLAFILFFFLPGIYFLKMMGQEGFSMTLLMAGTIPIVFGILLSWFIWKF